MVIHMLTVLITLLFLLVLRVNVYDVKPVEDLSAVLQLEMHAAAILLALQILLVLWLLFYVVLLPLVALLRVLQEDLPAVITVNAQLAKVTIHS